MSDLFRKYLRLLVALIKQISTDDPIKFNKKPPTELYNQNKVTQFNTVITSTQQFHPFIYININTIQISTLAFNSNRGLQNLHDSMKFSYCSICIVARCIPCLKRISLLATCIVSVAFSGSSVIKMRRYNLFMN